MATRDGTRGIRFDWFAFSHEAIHPAPEGEDIRVFYGSRLRSEVLPKPVAASTDPYSSFFDCRGHFKRVSAIDTEPRRRSTRGRSGGPHP